MPKQIIIYYLYHEGRNEIWHTYNETNSYPTRPKAEGDMNLSRGAAPIKSGVALLLTAPVKTWDYIHLIVIVVSDLLRMYVMG